MVFGVTGAAWPLIRTDLGLNYVQIGLALSLPGKSGTVLALDTVSGLFGKLLPFGIGLAAQVFGLQWAMWLLLAGPVALFIGLPRDAHSLHAKEVTD